MTPYVPTLMLTLVPGDSAPGKDAGLGDAPVTFIVKSDATFEPPLSLVTFLMTISFGAMSSLTIVQVMFCPAVSVT